MAERKSVGGREKKDYQCVVERKGIVRVWLRENQFCGREKGDYQCVVKENQCVIERKSVW